MNWAPEEHKESIGASEHLTAPLDSCGARLNPTLGTSRYLGFSFLKLVLLTSRVYSRKAYVRLIKWLQLIIL